jgi:hypothetical protein
MAGKKPQKKSKSGTGAGSRGKPTVIGMLQDLISTMPDHVKLDLVSAMVGGPPPDDFFVQPRPKPRSKVEREIQHLREQARSQDTTNAALPFLVQAEEAARKAIGKRFEKLAGHMGDDAAGERYLDVKLELAQALNAAGQREAALAHAEEVFRLDPEDPLEARTPLLAGYFELDRNDDAERLLGNECSEPWAAWLFGRLLLDLRRGKRGPEVEEQLKLAQQANPFVVSLLLGLRMPDPVGPDGVETGEDSEAQEYAASYLAAWKNTPGAISWLREAAARLGLDIRPPDAQAPEPERLTAREYATLPAHEHATWVVGFHDMGISHLPGEEEAAHHWLTFAVSTANDLIGFDLSDHEPGIPELWESLTEFMIDERNTGRPDTMLVHPATLLPRLKAEARRAKIALEPLEQGEQLTEMLCQIADRVQGGASSAASLDPDTIRQAPLDVDEVWEAALVALQRRLSVGGQSLRPWVALVMSRTSGTILWHELFTNAPPEGALANAVRMAIARPTAGPPRRPRQVLVRDADEAMSLQSLSAEAGFTCTADAELPMVADAIESLTQELLGGDEPEVVLCKAAGIEPIDLERYYTAAAAFYRTQPWKWFAMDELVGLDRQGQPGARRYALAMGQSGITQGLAIYERLKDIDELFAARTDQLFLDSFSVMFGEDGSIAPADLDAIEQFGWPIATPEAYPDALRIRRGHEVETPTAEDIRFLTCALEAVAWLAQHRDQNSTTVTVAGTSLSATRLGHVGTVKEPT